MAKNKTQIHVSTVFDGELNATDVFVNLISHKYRGESEKQYIAQTEDEGYNEHEVHKNRIPSGLCG